MHDLTGLLLEPLGPERASPGFPPDDPSHRSPNGAFHDICCPDYPPVARATSPIACFPDEGQIEEESLGNKVL